MEIINKNKAEMRNVEESLQTMHVRKSGFEICRVCSRHQPHFVNGGSRKPDANAKQQTTGEMLLCSNNVRSYDKTVFCDALRMTHKSCRACKRCQAILAKTIQAREEDIKQTTKQTGLNKRVPIVHWKDERIKEPDHFESDSGLDCMVRMLHDAAQGTSIELGTHSDLTSFIGEAFSWYGTWPPFTFMFLGDDVWTKESQYELISTGKQLEQGEKKLHEQILKARKGEAIKKETQKKQDAATEIGHEKEVAEKLRKTVIEHTKETTPQKVNKEQAEELDVTSIKEISSSAEDTVTGKTKEEKSKKTIAEQEGHSKKPDAASEIGHDKEVAEKVRKTVVEQTKEKTPQKVKKEQAEELDVTSIKGITAPGGDKLTGKTKEEKSKKTIAEQEAHSKKQGAASEIGHEKEVSEKVKETVVEQTKDTTPQKVKKEGPVEVDVTSIKQIAAHGVDELTGKTKEEKLKKTIAEQDAVSEKGHEKEVAEKVRKTVVEQTKEKTPQKVKKDQAEELDVASIKEITAPGGDKLTGKTKEEKSKKTIAEQEAYSKKQGAASEIGHEKEVSEKVKETVVEITAPGGDKLTGKTKEEKSKKTIAQQEAYSKKQGAASEIGHEKEVSEKVKETVVEITAPGGDKLTGKTKEEKSKKTIAEQEEHSKEQDAASEIDNEKEVAEKVKKTAVGQTKETTPQKVKKEGAEDLGVKSIKETTASTGDKLTGKTKDETSKKTVVEEKAYPKKQDAASEIDNEKEVAGKVKKTAVEQTREAIPQKIKKEGAEELDVKAIKEITASTGDKLTEKTKDEKSKKTVVEEKAYPQKQNAAAEIGHEKEVLEKVKKTAVEQNREATPQKIIKEGAEELDVTSKQISKPKDDKLIAEGKDEKPISSGVSRGQNQENMKKTETEEKVQPKINGVTNENGKNTIKPKTLEPTEETSPEKGKIGLTKEATAEAETKNEKARNTVAEEEAQPKIKDTAVDKEVLKKGKEVVKPTKEEVTAELDMKSIGTPKHIEGPKDGLIFNMIQQKKLTPNSPPPKALPAPTHFTPANSKKLFSYDLEKNKVQNIEDMIIFGPYLLRKKDVPLSEQIEESKLVPSKPPLDETHVPLPSEGTVKEDQRKKSISQTPTQNATPGRVCYALSDPTFIEKGWTVLPVEKVVRKMNVYRMRPARPEFDWFERNKNKKVMYYDTGEKLAEFDDNGRGRWYYRNGRLALHYYDSAEQNAQHRFVIYSSGELDDRGRSHPITVLGTFDFLGNGVVFDHSGKIRLKYNQTEGIVLDRSLGPVSKWKWHSLNDPPVLQQVMIDTRLAHKDPVIMKLGNEGDKRHGDKRHDNEEMLAIEFENFLKEKKNKSSKKYEPFQIKMKALKINECFSLRVLDQATVYLLFRDGTTNLKLNMGMVLDHEEIVDTETTEVGEVSTNVERLPAATESLAGIQNSLLHAQKVERAREEKLRRLQQSMRVASIDRIAAATSRPMRKPLMTEPTSTDVTNNAGASCPRARYRKPTTTNLYYNTRILY